MKISPKTRIRFRAETHRVGVSVVNGLSSRLHLRVFRGGSEWFIRFRDAEQLQCCSPKSGRRWFGPRVSGRHGNWGHEGAEITFLPSRETFTNTDFDFTTLGTPAA